MILDASDSSLNEETISGAASAEALVASDTAPNAPDKQSHIPMIYSILRLAGTSSMRVVGRHV